ncbi:small nuclear ribonucleoprotein-associated protein B' isoform X3 [Carcharodon carcharias]|uniref:small nuclear ribonucleoprotein-associated protein B' isoform X3 n=1 Tax=Carcharodon carcharias TaxID=13397 RepID=UPI001B7E9A65|nr:small nuclear ribonucleoprotein-associated protein B' isoform X3 [Carcharodon carcharias]
MEANFDEQTGSDNIRGRGGKGRGKGGQMARGRSSRGVFGGPKNLGPPSRGESSGRFGRGQAAANGFGSARFRGGGPPPPRLPVPPPPGPMCFRGRPPFIRGRSMQRGVFSPQRGFHNGPGAPLPPPPPGRGQRWPGPPGGRHF